MENLRNVLYKVICETTLGETPTVTEFNNFVHEIEDIVKGVQTYSFNNCEDFYNIDRNNLPKLNAYSVHLVGIYGIDITKEHLPGGSLEHEVEERFGITPAALEYALCSRDGRSVCNGDGCTRNIAGGEGGHVIDFLTPESASRVNGDYTLPLVLGIRQEKYRVHPNATDEQIANVAQKIHDITYGHYDQKGCFAYTEVSSGSLAFTGEENDLEEGRVMICTEAPKAFKYVTRFMVPRVVGSLGCSGSPQCGDFIMSGAKKSFRRLLQGATSQIQVRPEPNEEEVDGYKASMRIHEKDGDALVVSTLWITNTAKQGGKHSLGSLVQVSQGQKGLWVGATWLVHAIPLPLLFMALGVTDHKSLLTLMGRQVFGSDDDDDVLPQYIFSSDYAFDDPMIYLKKSIYDAHALIESETWIPQEMHLADKARVFIVEKAYRRNRHQQVAKGKRRNVLEMAKFFRKHIVPSILPGCAGYNNVERLATLQWMAIRVMECSREQMKKDNDPNYLPTTLPSDLNHIGLMRLYGPKWVLSQVLRMSLRRSMSKQIPRLHDEMEKANWDDTNLRFDFKVGDGSNQARGPVSRGCIQVGKRIISGISVISGDKSPLDSFESKYVIVKEGTKQSPANIRSLHTTSYGVICPVKTPEGEKVGLTLNAAKGMISSPNPEPDAKEKAIDMLSQTGHFIAFDSMDQPSSLPTPSSAKGKTAVKMHKYSRPRGLDGLLAHSCMYRVIIDGICVGVTDNPQALVWTFRRIRRTVFEMQYVSITFFRGAVVVQTTEGRLGRYLIVLENGMVPLPPLYQQLMYGSWADLGELELDEFIRMGVIEFVSVLESETIKIRLGEPERTPVIEIGGKWYKDMERIYAPQLQEIEDAHSIDFCRDLFDPSLLQTMSKNRILFQLTNEHPNIFKIIEERKQVKIQEVRDLCNLRVPYKMDAAMLYDLDQNRCAYMVDTHMEIHDDLILGIAASMQPFLECNAAPRCSYGSIHVTQAVSHPAPNLLSGSKFATSKVARCTDPNIARTKIYDFVPPGGGSLKLVAIRADPATSEDASKITQKSLDLDPRNHFEYDIQFRRVFDRRFPLPTEDKQDTVIVAFPGEYGDQEKLQNLERLLAANQPTPHLKDFRGILCEQENADIFEFFVKDQNPEREDEILSLTRNKKVNYGTLDADGIPTVGTTLFPGDAVIGSVTVMKPTQGYSKRWYKDTTVTFNQKVPARVVRSSIEEHNGKIIVTVNCAHFKKATVGDKGALSYGQKGVRGTISRNGEQLCIAHHDPRFDGMDIELEFNPNHFSRNTAGIYRQISTNWLAMHRGHYSRGTFSEIRWDDGTEFEELCHLLKTEVGIDPFARFALRNPATGEIIGEKCWKRDSDGNLYQTIKPTMFYVGYLFYKDLPHWSNLKWKANGVTPKDTLTRQPRRKKGLRIGEMERDCLIAHGASVLLQERLSADNYYCPVCEKCGHVAVYNSSIQEAMCHSCKYSSDIVLIRIPYAAKLLVQELYSMLISVQFRFEKDIAMINDTIIGHVVRRQHTLEDVEAELEDDPNNPDLIALRGRLLQEESANESEEEEQTELDILTERLRSEEEKLDELTSGASSSRSVEAQKKRIKKTKKEIDKERKKMFEIEFLQEELEEVLSEISSIQEQITQLQDEEGEEMQIDLLRPMLKDLFKRKRLLTKQLEK